VVGEPVGERGLDLAIEVITRAGRTGRAAVQTGWRLSAPVAELALRPPLVPRRYWPGTRLQRWADSGHIERQRREKQLRAGLDVFVPRVSDLVLDRIDLNGIVGRVDIDAIVATVDLDAVIDRIPIERILNRIDIDAIVATVDLDAIIDRIPIDRILNRIDIDAIVATVDLDAIIDRIPIDRILNRIDIDAIAARIDIDAIIARIDVSGIARQVIDDIDLPEIIRESSGAMASETVVGVRMRGIEADERINRIVDRVLLRRHGRLDQGPSVDSEHHG
jgi:hypothetical protein